MKKVIICPIRIIRSKNYSFVLWLTLYKIYFCIQKLSATFSKGFCDWQVYYFCFEYPFFCPFFFSCKETFFPWETTRCTFQNLFLEFSTSVLKYFYFLFSFSLFGFTWCAFFFSFLSLKISCIVCKSICCRILCENLYLPNFYNKFQIFSIFF